MENLNGNASGVNSLCPGELFDFELSKKDSSLGLSVTVLFGKVFTVFLFWPLPPPPLHLVTLSVWVYMLLGLVCFLNAECCLIWKLLRDYCLLNSVCMLPFF